MSDIKKGPAERSIKFDEKFMKPIKDGVKTSTIRVNFDGSSGDVFDCFVNLSNGIGGSIGKVRIKHVQRIRFDEISREKAMTEGYLHESLIKHELLQYYPSLKDSSLLYYIVFDYLVNEEPEMNTPLCKGGK